MALLVQVASHGEQTCSVVPCLIVRAKDDLDPSPVAIQDSMRVCHCSLSISHPYFWNLSLFFLVKTEIYLSISNIIFHSLSRIFVFYYAAALLSTIDIDIHLITQAIGISTEKLRKWKLKYSLLENVWSKDDHSWLVSGALTRFYRSMLLYPWRLTSTILKFILVPIISYLFGWLIPVESFCLFLWCYLVVCIRHWSTLLAPSTGRSMEKLRKWKVTA